MGIPETQKELLAYLASMTRDAHGRPSSCFTTVEIARALSISRNLASQYLNELARAGLVVKAGSRPVHYFHRRNLERALHTELTELSFPSVEALFEGASTAGNDGFEAAIGRSGSLARAIEQIKAAVAYPPHGLPVLLMGPTGSGRTLMAELALEYCRREGLVPADAQMVHIDCADAADAARCAGWLRGEEDLPLPQQAGCVCFEHAESLSATDLTRIVSWLEEGVAGKHVRGVFVTSAEPDDSEGYRLVQELPMAISIPSLLERSVEEREALAVHFLREEGRRMGVDVYVSRGALRCLAGASFEDNVRGLASAVTRSCAEAYLASRDGRLEIRTYQLPAALIGTGGAGDERDGALIDVQNDVAVQREDRIVQLLDVLLRAHEAYRGGGIAEPQLLASLDDGCRDIEDCLTFGEVRAPVRLAAFEQVLGSIFEDVNRVYAIGLSKLGARLAAREIGLQLYPSPALARWKSAHADELRAIEALVARCDRFSTAVCGRIDESVSAALGIELDILTRLLVTLHVRTTQGSISSRRCLGVVLSHGYSTATSIADAANRILAAHVFEAIDMPYDQQVKDVIGPLRTLMERFSFCDEMALLVDMGSLEDIYKDLGPLSGTTLGVINNASTGLAVEVGAGIVAGRSVADILEFASERCACRYRVLERASKQDAVVFCSEGGTDAAEKIKTLVAQSFESEPAVRLVVCDYRQLAANGSSDAVFGEYAVRALIGTADPHIDGVPYVALEDLIVGEDSGVIDRVFSRALSTEGLAAFRQNLVKNMTLRNVVESITILNPDRLFAEIELAIDRLERLTGKQIDTRATIGLHVHLCCLVERLVTRSPIEAYADEEAFTARNRAFIEAFRTSFADISVRYHVEVPVAEIAYVYDYITSRRVPRKRAFSPYELEKQEDE